MTTTLSSPSSPSSAWSDLPRRLGTIAIGFPFVVCLLSHYPWVFFRGVHLLCAMEYANMMPAPDVAFVFVSMGVAHCMERTSNLAALISGFAVLFLRHLATSQQQQHHAVRGLLFLTLPMTVWYAVAQHDTRQALSLLLICWNCDTGALIVGRIAKPYAPTQPLWLANISPAKSLAGMVGGLGLGTLTAVAIPSLWRLAGYHETIPAFSATLGMQLSVLAVLGDLVESAIKRQSKQKDSSSLLPGHGGILDRFDSSLFAVVAYSYHLESNR